MKPKPLTVGTLMLAVASFGVAFAALKDPTREWAAALSALAVALLVAAVPKVAFGRGADRAFWIGFSGLGWLYLILSFGPYTLASAWGLDLLDLLHPGWWDRPPAYREIAQATDALGFAVLGGLVARLVAIRFGYAGARHGT